MRDALLAYIDAGGDGLDVTVIEAAQQLREKAAEKNGYYGPPRRVYYGPPPPWSREWYAYCHSRYRSFDPYSGTYQPYRGPRRFCR